MPHTFPALPAHAASLPDERRWGPLASAALVLLVALLLSFGAWDNARRDTAADLKARFEFRAHELSTSIVVRMAVYEQVLRGTRGLMHGGTDLSRAEFADYFQIQRLQEHFPGIQAVGIASVMPAPAGDLLTAITHIEPFTGRNLRAFGYNMYGDPVRRAAMDAARDTGAAAISGKVILVQEGRDPQPGFLMYLPLYQRGAPQATLAQRRAALIGWVFAPFRMGDLLHQLGAGHASELGLRVYDGISTAPSSLLISMPATPGTHAPMFQQTRTVQVAGHAWTIVINSSAAFEARRDARRPQVIAVTGAGLSVLLALVVYLLANARQHALQLARSMTLELRQASERTEAERARIDLILQHSYDAFIAIDARGHITDWNARATQQFGWPRAEVLGADIGALLAPTPTAHALAPGFAQLAPAGQMLLPGEPAELMVRQQHGQLVPVEIMISALPADAGASAFLRDITPRREAEARERLRQQGLDEARSALARAQKLDAVGKLSGGLTHDFNNILHIISANVQLLQQSGTNSEKRLRSILDAVERGTKLSSQLLAFARRQSLQPSVVKVDELLERMDSLLQRAAGDAVTIRHTRPHALWDTLVDPNQLENVILNLVINGRDAMDAHGTLTIALENVSLDAAVASADPERQPGDYVRITVSDTGCGMPPEVIERVFEPFFTTKPEGKGTGLGLSIAHGFVRQSGGHIQIDSVPAEGSSIALYLPRAAAAQATA